MSAQAASVIGLMALAVDVISNLKSQISNPKSKIAEHGELLLDNAPENLL